MLKPIQVTDTLETFSSNDPAINFDEMDIEQQEDLANLLVFKPSEAWKKVKVKDGEHLTRFTLIALKPDVISKILDQTERIDSESGKPVIDQRARNWRFFLESIHSVEGWDIPQKNGGPDKDWLRNNFRDNLYPVALELGARAMYWNTISEEERKNLFGRLKRKKTSAAQTAQNAPINSEQDEAAESQATT